MRENGTGSRYQDQMHNEIGRGAGAAPATTRPPAGGVRDEIAEHVERDDEAKRSGRQAERVAIAIFARRCAANGGGPALLDFAKRIEAGEHLK